MIMQEELLHQDKTKMYFVDIIGKADGGNLVGLSTNWWWLLELASQHGQKFKPTNAKWSFTRIETIGFEWSPQGIGIGRKNRDWVRSLTFPRNKSELRGLLGLANQLREMVAGYALLVTALTALTRGPDQKVVATPNALIELENLKMLLNSPPILEQFRYDRPTVVYTDTSIRTAELPGRLGAVTV